MSFQSLEDLSTALEGNEHKDEILKFIAGVIEAEKKSAEVVKTKANNESRNRREQLARVKQALQVIGYEEGAELDEFLQALPEKIGSVKNATPSGDDSEVAKELAKLRRDFDKTRKELEKERQLGQEIKSRAAQKTIRSKLADAFRDKVTDPELLVDSLMYKGQVALDDDDESVVFVDGDNRISLEEGVKSVLSARPGIVRNQQTAGARTTAGMPTSSKQKYTRQQLEGMTQAQVSADREAVYASWDAIRAAQLANK